MIPDHLLDTNVLTIATIFERMTIEEEAWRTFGTLTGDELSIRLHNDPGLPHHFPTLPLRMRSAAFLAFHAV
jgi:hypothetical protein